MTETRRKTKGMLYERGKEKGTSIAKGKYRIHNKIAK